MPYDKYECKYLFINIFVFEKIHCLFLILLSGNTPETRGTAFVVYEDIFDAKNACDRSRIHLHRYFMGSEMKYLEIKNRMTNLYTPLPSHGEGFKKINL